MYNFEDYKYNKIFFKTKKDYYYYYDYDDNIDLDEGYYDDEGNLRTDNVRKKYYSYDITDHFIGIFDVRTEELLTIIEYDFVKIMCNIKNKK